MSQVINEIDHIDVVQQGVPEAPTASDDTVPTQLATLEYVANNSGQGGVETFTTDTQDHAVGNVLIDASDVSLENADNTSDINKPISTSTQSALNNKMDANVDMVNTVNGRDGEVTITKSDVGLNNADNTSDLAKPISTATSTALVEKVDDTEGVVSVAGQGGGSTNRVIALYSMPESTYNGITPDSTSLYFLT